MGAVLLGLLGVVGFGSGMVAAAASRRPRVTLLVGLLVVSTLYAVYLFTVGEAPPERDVAAWGAAGWSVVIAGLALGVAAARLAAR